MKRRLIPFAVLFLLIPVLAIGSASAVGSFPVQIVDDAGRLVRIDRPPKRVISLAPSNTELLFAIGAGGRMVGVTRYCNYPPAAAQIARVGDVNLNFEEIVGLHPDLVVTVGSMQGDSIDRLEQLGCKVIVLEARKVADVPRHLRLLGRAMGLRVQAETQAQSFEKRIGSVAARTKLASVRPRVFVEIWNQPLISVGPGTYLDELIHMAGGVSISSDAKTQWPQFSEELVIQRNPEVIILTCFNRAEAMKRESWKSLSAMKTGRVYEVNPDIYVRPTPRLADGLEQLARWLHPEIYGKVKP